MKHDEIRALEEACETALAEALRKAGRVQESPRTCHLMAKAAVAVLEAVEEERRARK
jgi:hypothetical protein